MPTAFFDKKHLQGKLHLDKYVCTVSQKSISPTRANNLRAFKKKEKKTTQKLQGRALYLLTNCNFFQIWFYVHFSCIWPSILMANTFCIRGDTLVTMPLTKTIYIDWDKLELPPPGGQPDINTASGRPLKCCTRPQVITCNFKVQNGHFKVQNGNFAA